MSFGAFHDSIESADLRAVANQWERARGSQPFPAWSDINPSAISRQLKVVWAYSYDAVLGEFVGRLGGDVITQIFGRNLRGLRLSDLGHRINAGLAVMRSKRVMTEPALFRGRGRIVDSNGYQGFAERIVMPLSDNGVIADGIFGATEYKAERLATPDPLAEIENWFSLTDERFPSGMSPSPVRSGTRGEFVQLR